MVYEEKCPTAANRNLVMISIQWLNYIWHLIGKNGKSVCKAIFGRVVCVPIWGDSPWVLVSIFLQYRKLWEIESFLWGNLFWWQLYFRGYLFTSKGLPLTSCCVSRQKIKGNLLNGTQQKKKLWGFLTNCCSIQNKKGMIAVLKWNSGISLILKLLLCPNTYIN